MAAATAVARSAVASSSSCCRLSTCSGSPSVVVPVAVDVICPMQFVATALVSGRSFVVLVVLSAVAVSLCVFCCCGCGVCGGCGCGCCCCCCHLRPLFPTLSDPKAHTSGLQRFLTFRRRLLHNLRCPRWQRQAVFGPCTLNCING